MKSLVKKLAIAIIVVSITASFLFSDLKITGVSKTEPFMGQPAKEESLITYVSEDGMYVKRGEKLGFLYNAASKKVFVLLRENEQYMEVDWKKVNAQTAALADMMKGVKWEMVNTGRKEKVGKWDTAVWKFTMKSQFYTLELLFYQWEGIDLPKMYEEAVIAMSKLQGGVSEEMLNEFRKLKGYAVKQETIVKTAQGDVKQVAIVTEIETKNLKKSLFEVPEGYHKIDFDLIKLGQLTR